MLLLGALVVQTQTTKLAGLPAVTSATDGNDWTRTHSCGTFGAGGLDVVLGDGLGVGLGLGDWEGLGLVLGDWEGLGLVLGLELTLELGGGLELRLLVSDGLADEVLGDVLEGPGLGELVSDGLALDVALLVSVGVADAETVADEEPVGETVPLVASRRAIAEVKTVAADGGDAHTELPALVAAWTASPPNISIPRPKNASPRTAPHATGLRSSALTRRNLASACRPGSTLVVRLRHSTHGSLRSSRGPAMDTKGSRSCRLGNCRCLRG